uniref:Uncharacterized protein n=1 Tax=Ditylenchus dipsaci TaxID=166011 RepID=A0A915DG98_9BILA
MMSALAERGLVNVGILFNLMSVSCGRAENKGKALAKQAARTLACITTERSVEEAKLFLKGIYFTTDWKYIFVYLLNSGTMSLFTSPSYHHISPLTRSRSNSIGHANLRRSHSYTATHSGGGFTMPSYGYGGGFMSKSLSRSGSSLFGRSLSSTALNKTPPFSNVAVQRSTPHYSDKYPYVRYSYGNIDTGLSVLTQTELKSPNLYGVKDIGTKRWLEGKLNAYNTGLFTRPNYKSHFERPITPARNYVRYMPTDDAVNMFKNKFMTVGTLSKYWLSPTTYSTRRDKELNLSSASAVGRFSHASQYNQYSRPPIIPVWLINFISRSASSATISSVV